jgi:type IV secretion system protein VirB11
MSGQGLAEVQRARALEQLTIDLGAAIMEALLDPKVVEVMLNPDGNVWVDRLGEGMRCIGLFSGRSARSVIETTAGILNRVVNEDRPILECRLPLDGSRFEAVLPPLAAEPTFAIRKKAPLVFTFDDYVSAGIMTPEQRQALEAAVAARRNILVCGSTGSGKTTLANAVLDCLARQDEHCRVVVIEDTPELQVAVKNAVYLETKSSPPRVDQTDLLKVTMRLRPDRIVVGEVRDEAALALLKAWNTGHPGGVGTVHANDSKAALIRIGQLVQEAGVPEQPELIAEAVNVIVFISRTPTGRRVEDVSSVTGWSRERGYEVARLA